MEDIERAKVRPLEKQTNSSWRDSEWERGQVEGRLQWEIRKTSMCLRKKPMPEVSPTDKSRQIDFQEKISITGVEETSPDDPRIGLSNSVFYGMLVFVVT